MEASSGRQSIRGSLRQGFGNCWLRVVLGYNGCFFFQFAYGTKNHGASS